MKIGTGIGEMTWYDYEPSAVNAAASSPRAEDVSFARRSLPRDRIAFLRASALAAADMVVMGCWHLRIREMESKRQQSPDQQGGAARACQSTCRRRPSFISAMLFPSEFHSFHSSSALPNHVSSRQSNNRETRKDPQGTSQET